MKPAAALLTTALLIAACGQKGGLFLPEGEQSRVPPQPDSNPSTSGPVEQSDRDASRPRRIP